MAALPNKSNTPKKTKNPLLSGADVGFPFENLCGSAMLMPIALEETVAEKEDVPPPKLPPEPPATTSSPTPKPLFTLFKEALAVDKIFDPFSKVSNPTTEYTETVTPGPYDDNINPSSTPVSLYSAQNTPISHYDDNSSQGTLLTQNIHEQSIPSSYSDNMNSKPVPLYPAQNTPNLQYNDNLHNQNIPVTYSQNTADQTNSESMYASQTIPSSYGNDNLNSETSPVPLYHPQNHPKQAIPGLYSGGNLNSEPTPVTLYHPQNIHEQTTPSSYNDDLNLQTTPVPIYHSQTTPFSYGGENLNSETAPVTLYQPQSTPEPPTPEVSFSENTNASPILMYQPPDNANSHPSIFNPQLINDPSVINNNLHSSPISSPNFSIDNNQTPDQNLGSHLECDKSETSPQNLKCDSPKPLNTPSHYFQPKSEHDNNSTAASFPATVSSYFNSEMSTPQSKNQINSAASFFSSEKLNQNSVVQPNIFNPNQTIPVSIFSPLPPSSTPTPPQATLNVQPPPTASLFNPQEASKFPPSQVQPNIFNPNQTIPVSIFSPLPPSNTQESTPIESLCPVQASPYSHEENYSTGSIPSSMFNSLPLSSTHESTPVQSVPSFSPQCTTSVQQNIYSRNQNPVSFYNPNQYHSQGSNVPMYNHYPTNTVYQFNSMQATPMTHFNPVSESQMAPVQPIPVYPPQVTPEHTQGGETQETSDTSVSKIQNLFSSNVSLYDNFPASQPQMPQNQVSNEEPKTESPFMPYFTPISEPTNSRPQSQTSAHSKTSRPPSVTSNVNSAPNVVTENRTSRPSSANSINSNISNSIPPNFSTISESSIIQNSAVSFFDNPINTQTSEIQQEFIPKAEVPKPESKTPVQLFNPNMFRQPQKSKTPKYVNPNCYASVKTNVSPQDSFIPNIPDASVKLFNPNAFVPEQSNTPPLVPQNDQNSAATFFDKPPVNAEIIPPPPTSFFTPAKENNFNHPPISTTPKQSIPTPPILEEATFINQSSASIFGPIDTPPVPLFQSNTTQVPLYNPNIPPSVPLFNEHKILNQFPQAVPLYPNNDDEKSTSPQPASIPVSVSQINPKLSHVLNPYSKSTAVSAPVPQVFTPPSVPSQQDVSQCVSEASVSSASPPPPPKSNMSGGNSYRLGGNSRPQYAPPPGFGQSVSAIASLAASMAMSAPMPVPGSHYDPQPMVPTIVASAPGVSSAAELFNPASLPTDVNAGTYRPVYQHWFYKRIIETRDLWMPFSMKDSLELEKAFNSGDKDVVIATDGGRYDVHVASRRREPVYWSQPANEVRRCSWFYRGALDSRSTPYEETFAERLEEEYRNVFLANYWPHRVEMSYGEAIIMNGPANMVHIPPTSGSILEDWGTIQEQGTKPRTVRRGCEEFDIDEGEPGKPDHLLFLVHGIGSACDLKFRSVVEVVDDFRSMALTLVRSHFRVAGEEGRVNRVEVLPVSWHSALHGEETGIDKQLQGITLKSIPRLRHFTNDTLLDILFYTSPVYCQTIIRQVGHELNRLQQVFLRRNPEFNGGISLGGHSLGSLILFDLLCHQKPVPGLKTPLVDPMMFDEEVEDDLGDEPVPPPRHLRRRESCRVDYMVGPAGTGQPSITYPQLHFSPMAFFALGSPIAMFVTVRGIESLGQDFCLPTCPAFFNIFHPFDPVAYRIEALVNTELSKLRPVLVPHHKGRKRMHIELRETMARVGTDLKERLVDSVKSTWNSVYQLAMFNRGEILEQEVDKVLAQQMLATEQLQEEPLMEDMSDPDPQILGRLNCGRRVDYVLQEAPLESFNEYLFALGSHVCYWESEDTMLMMLKEIYTMLGIPPDRQMDRSRESSMVRDVPRERSWSAGSNKGSVSPSQYFINQNRPTPPATPPTLSPPPTSGFVRK